MTSEDTCKKSPEKLIGALLFGGFEWIPLVDDLGIFESYIS